MPTLLAKSAVATFVSWCTPRGYRGFWDDGGGRPRRVLDATEDQSGPRAVLSDAQAQRQLFLTDRHDLDNVNYGHQRDLSRLAAVFCGTDLFADIPTSASRLPSDLFGWQT